MRSDVNLAVQLTAVVGTVMIRFATPGFLLLVFFLLVPLASAALMGQIALAVLVMPRGKLTAGLSVGFMGLAASTLGVATFLPDDIDSSGRQKSPVGLLLGHEPAPSTAIVRILLTVWLVSMIWVVIGVVRSRRPAPPVFPHPAPVSSFPNPPGR